MYTIIRFNHIWMIQFLWVDTKEFKRGNPVSFWPYCQLPMEVSYCTLEFGTIFWQPAHIKCEHYSPCDNLYVCAWFHAGKATHALQNNLAGLTTKKSGGTITCLHKWWQDGRHKGFPLKISLVDTYLCLIFHLAHLFTGNPEHYIFFTKFLFKK